MCRLVMMLPRIGIVDDWSANGNTNVISNFGIVQVVVFLLPAIVRKLLRWIPGKRWLYLSLGELDGISFEFLEGIIGEVIEAAIGKLVGIHGLRRRDGATTSLPLQAMRCTEYKLDENEGGQCK